MSETAVWCSRRVAHGIWHDAILGAAGEVSMREVFERAHRDVAFVEALALLLAWMNEEGK